jgi:hypothetical protein
MDQRQYSTLLEAVADVPDPPHARGKQHAWKVILAVICAALVSGHQSGRAIGQWSREHAKELLRGLRPKRGRLPSEATLRRALRSIDVAALEARLIDFGLHQAAPLTGCIISPHGEVLQAQAIDGKTVCGAPHCLWHARWKPTPAHEALRVGCVRHRARCLACRTHHTCLSLMNHYRRQQSNAFVSVFGVVPPLL